MFTKDRLMKILRSAGVILALTTFILLMTQQMTLAADPTGVDGTADSSIN